jgi:hypothetical protein
VYNVSYISPSHNSKKMKHLFIKRIVTIWTMSFVLFGGPITTFAQGWDTGSVGTYTGGWDTGSVGTYTGGWDTGSVGTYTGGWDTGSVGTYTGGWDTGSVGTYTGGWDTGSVGTYTGGWDTGSVGTYTGGWDTGSVGTYTGGWDTGSVGTYTGGWDTGSVGTYTGGWDTGNNTTGYGSVGWSTTPVNTTWNTGTVNTGWVNTGTVNTGWVNTGTVVTNTSCPVNSTWNGTNCVSTVTGTVITQTNCPTGTAWNGTNCVQNVNGTVVTNVNCPTGTTRNGNTCVNNVTGTVVTNTNCPTGTTWNGTNCIQTVTGTVVTNTSCPVNSTWNGTNCVSTVTGTVITQTNCPTGTAWNGTNCIQTVTGTVVTNTSCPVNSTWNGTNCVSTYTPPVVTNTSCPSNTQYINGVCQQIISAPVVTYQTCWDGSVIPAYSVCAAQYKVCSNGISIPINQTCYVATTPIISPIKVVFNNVVTSLATEVTHNQGRCNGIGLIAQGAPSTGWFEYGETANLGRTTVSANIGSSDTAPFSNLLTNLKPSTKYYCRAVMQNKHGIVKGEVVSFTTKGKATTYVKPVAATPVKRPTTTKVPVKNEVICSDGTTVSVKNQSAATLLTEGQKLVSLNIEKTEGKIASEGIVKFKVSFKNITDSRLTETVVKVKLPEEIRLLETSAGIYDATTRTITLNQDTVDPYTEGVITLSGVVAKDAALGKTIVTNAYVAYTVPGTNTQDEVTAYVIGSVVPVGDTGTASVGEKKVVGAKAESKGFLPNSLIEWLALLAIIFIIFILARSIYASYKEGDSAHH